MAGLQQGENTRASNKFLSELFFFYFVLNKDFFTDFTTKRWINLCFYFIFLCFVGFCVDFCVVLVYDIDN